MRATLQELLDQGKLCEHPLSLQPGGLKGVSSTGDDQGQENLWEEIDLYNDYTVR